MYFFFTFLHVFSKLFFYSFIHLTVLRRLQCRLWETGCPVDPCDASAGFIRSFKQLKPWDWAGIPKTATYSASHEFSHWCLVFARCTELLVPPETSLLHKLFECDDLCQFARELWNIHQQANNKNTSPSPPKKKRYRTKPMARLMQTQYCYCLHLEEGAAKSDAFKKFKRDVLHRGI